MEYNASSLLGKRVVAVRHMQGNEDGVNGIELEGGIKVSSTESLVVCDFWSDSVNDGEHDGDSNGILDEEKRLE